MLRTALVSVAAIALSAGVANADVLFLGSDRVVTTAIERPVVVERRAAVIPSAPVTIVRPAQRVVVVSQLPPLPPGAVLGADDNDRKQVARPLPRHRSAPAGTVVVYR